MKTIAIFITLTLGLFSCSKTITCTDPQIDFAFISFPARDIDTLVLKKFSPDNNFQNLLDTIDVFSNVTASTVLRADTTYISLYDIYKKIKPGFDWQIFIPATKRTIFISNITKDDKTEKCGALFADCFCRNKIVSIKLDNQIVQFNSYPGDVLFIR